MSSVKEIWCMHHSHLDIGYTHPQPLLLKLQEDYIDDAIALCERTADYPEYARFRWTCEATYVVLNWLKTATEVQRDRFKRLLDSGYISVAALPMHTTPNCNYAQMVQMMQQLNELRTILDTPIQTAINHDVNGQPWPLSQAMLDNDINFYLTGINIHFGGFPLNRPAAFRWVTPDSRELLSYIGQHYSLFSQFLFTCENSTAKTHQGVQDYLAFLDKQGYDREFAFLTATNPPLFDNNCPDFDLADLIRRYNAEDHEQKIRFVTPEILRDRLIADGLKKLPAHAGDWTDYWNFGSASTARETRVNRCAKQALRKAELLEAIQGAQSQRYQQTKSDGYLNSIIYDEHTWGASQSVTHPDDLEVRDQYVQKVCKAYEAASLSAYCLGYQLEQFTDNNKQCMEYSGLLALNTSGAEQTIPLYIPESWLIKGRKLAALRVKDLLPYNEQRMTDAVYAGNITLPAYGYKRLELNTLQAQSKANKVFLVQADSIETPFYHIDINPQNGRILQVTEKATDWTLLNASSEWTLFEYVHETIDTMHDSNQRTTFFPRDTELGNRSVSVWNHQWHAKREHVNKVLSHSVEVFADRLELCYAFESDGLRSFTQCVTFSAVHPRIGMRAEFNKGDVRTPESCYFAIPLNLEAGWSCYYDTAGCFVRLDEQQLPGTCRDWLTVDNTVGLFDEHHGAVLVCRDAPLVQVGDFNFGKESAVIKRDEKPLLLAWPMNNYWDTNFAASQPGIVSFYYELMPQHKFNAANTFALGQQAADAVVMFPLTESSPGEGSLLDITNPNIVLLHSQSRTEETCMLTIKNLTDDPQSGSFNLPNKIIVAAWLTNAAGEHLHELSVTQNSVAVVLQKQQIAMLTLKLRS